MELTITDTVVFQIILYCGYVTLRYVTVRYGMVWYGMVCYVMLCYVRLTLSYLQPCKFPISFSQQVYRAYIRINIT